MDGLFIQRNNWFIRVILGILGEYNISKKKKKKEETDFEIPESREGMLPNQSISD